jgi:hypothetical protein
MTKHVAAALLTALLVGCEGPAGPEGPEGPQGPTGPQGPSGASPKTNYVCEGNTTTSRGTFTFSHSIYEMTDGSVFASCSVLTPAQEITSFVIYRASQPGAATGSCFVLADTDGTVDFGVWNMRATLGAATIEGSATYRNTNSGDNGKVAPLTCTRY